MQASKEDVINVLRGMIDVIEEGEGTCVDIDTGFFDKNGKSLPMDPSNDSVDMIQTTFLMKKIK